MDISGKTLVVTGGASGIGAALCAQAAGLGAQVVVADRDLDAAQQVAEAISGVAVQCDVGSESGVVNLIDEVTRRLCEIDVFVSNAGFGCGEPDHAASAPDEVWDLAWRVHVMAHVWAARALLPAMIRRRAGYFVNVASAAGLLNQIGDAAYSATKHAAVSFAESLAITHGADGIGVSVVCPQYVATPLIGLTEQDARDRDSLLTADQVARTVLEGVAAKKFLILSHPEVAKYTSLRAQDHDRWLTGMQKLRQVAQDQLGEVKPETMYKLV